MSKLACACTRTAPVFGRYAWEHCTTGEALRREYQSLKYQVRDFAFNARCQNTADARKLDRLHARLKTANRKLEKHLAH